MFSLPTNDWFAINIKGNNKDNNIITIIKELFVNIKNKLSYKRSVKKMSHKIYEFLYYFVSYMSFKDRVVFCRMR